MPLHSRDVQKLLNSGFTIIRADNENLKIKCKNKRIRDWKTMEAGFKSKAELRRKMNSWLEMELIIED